MLLPQTLRRTGLPLRRVSQTRPSLASSRFCGLHIMIEPLRGAGMKAAAKLCWMSLSARQRPGLEHPLKSAGRLSVRLFFGAGTLVPVTRAIFHARGTIIATIPTCLRCGPVTGSALLPVVSHVASPRCRGTAIRNSQLTRCFCAECALPGPPSTQRTHLAPLLRVLPPHRSLSRQSSPQTPTARPDARPDLRPD